MKKVDSQVAATVEPVAEDHAGRYRFAVEKAKHYSAKSIIDVGAGTGYGSKLLADETDADVYSYESKAEAAKDYAHERVSRRSSDVAKARVKADMITAFGAKPADLAKLTKKAKVVVGSASSDKVTASDLRAQLAKSGWRVVAMKGQAANAAAVTDSLADAATFVYTAKSDA